jgi:hypothetical protein
MADASMSHTQPLQSVYVEEQHSRIVTQSHPESVRQQIIERYLAGDKITVIESATGVSRPTIYTYIKDAGYTPARATKTKPVHTRDVMEQLAEANQEIGRLQARLEIAYEEIERLKKRRH